MSKTLKSRIASGELVIGEQLRLGSPAIAEMFGLAGFDFLLIDSEHAPQTPVGIQCQLQAAQATTATGIVRLGNSDPDLIRLYLDMGAGGILVPLIRTEADVRFGAEACFYPPKGTRGFGPARAASYGLDKQYFETANDDVVFSVMIETQEAVENIDAVLAVEGLDTFFIGPCDLSLALGVPFDYGHPRFREAVQRVLAAASNAGKSAGYQIFGDIADGTVLGDLVDQGFTVFVAGTEEWMLSAAAKRVMEVWQKAKRQK